MDDVEDDEGDVDDERDGTLTRNNKKKDGEEVEAGSGSRGRSRGR